LYEQTVVPNEEYYSVYNTLTGAIRPVRLKGTEPAAIDYVAVNGTNSKGFLEKVRAPLPQVKPMFKSIRPIIQTLIWFVQRVSSYL
jgi:hypothetical protein